MSATSYGHDAPPPEGPAVAPLFPVERAITRSPAEEARTLAVGTRVASLATLSEDGSPWASLVTFATLSDGAPVLCVSTLAEHGRNLMADPRASLMITQAERADDPLAEGRVTLAGRAEVPTGVEAERARAAYVSAIGPSATYVGFGDFTVWVLRVERVRWVGGYGRMASAGAGDYATADADPVGPASPGAVDHLNADHRDALLAMARGLAGYPDATGATCRGADRYGLELWVETPRGNVQTRLAFAEPVAERDGLRQATVDLTRAARAAEPIAG